VNAQGGNRGRGSGAWLPSGTKPRRAPAKKSKARKPAARKAAASTGRAKKSEWLPSGRALPSADIEPGANGSQTRERSRRPKGRIRAAIERRRLAAELREARKELDEERRRSADLTAEVDKLKKARRSKSAR